MTPLIAGMAVKVCFAGFDFLCVQDIRLTYSPSSQTTATGVSADRLSAPRGRGIRIEIMHSQCNTDGRRQALLQKVLHGMFVSLLSSPSTDVR